MNQRPIKGWLKHIDFIILDILCLQVSFVLAHAVLISDGNPYGNSYYRYLILMLSIGQVLTFFVIDNYSGIIRRGYLEELYSILHFTATMLVITLLLLFAFHTTYIVSRLLTGWTMVAYVALDYFFRYLNKRRIMKRSSESLKRLGRSLFLFSPGYKIEEAVEKLTAPGMFRDYFITGCVVTDQTPFRGEYDFPVMRMEEHIIEKLRTVWIDDAFILQSQIDQDMIETLIDMGITVHLCNDLLSDEMWGAAEISRMGRYTALTRSLRTVSSGQMMAKRCMDLIGGIFGCILTAILFIFVAPLIYIASPGPIFFSQERIGRGGKPFKMYKFRSMYPDAEKRKKDLETQNKADGLIFKVDNDPRIIKGIGHFLRRSSIDEFPQFYNTLKGDMSLVGTRPPLREEWEKYDVHHRARMTVKPGITGLWQVSGRSEITDFDEIVQMDMDYIENWNLKLDFKIILKTIVVVITGRGAE